MICAGHQGSFCSLGPGPRYCSGRGTREGVFRHSLSGFPMLVPRLKISALYTWAHQERAVASVSALASALLPPSSPPLGLQMEQILTFT